MIHLHTSEVGAVRYNTPCSSLYLSTLLGKGRGNVTLSCSDIHSQNDLLTPMSSALPWLNIRVKRGLEIAHGRGEEMRNLLSACQQSINSDRKGKEWIAERAGITCGA